MSDPDLSSLDGLIRKLRQARGFLVKAAPAAAAAMQGALRATAAAGTAPDGSPWAPRKRDGGRALAGAASAITVRPVGTVLLAKLRFPEVIHDAGNPPILPRRQIIPHGALPETVMQAIKDALIEAWRSEA